MPTHRPPIRTILFETEIGWCSLSRSGTQLARVRMGFKDRQQLFEQLMAEGNGPTEADASEQKWVQTLQAFLSGTADPATGRAPDFSTFAIDETWMTDFQRRCVGECRRIAAGQTVTYGELANRIGAPKAARAVGSVMKKNRYPLVVPCHRVVSASGIGGFNAPAGVSLKAKLLELDKRLINGIFPTG